jgi:hypothetical protein
MNFAQDAARGAFLSKRQKSAATADQTAPTAAKIANPKATQINMMGVVERKLLKNVSACISSDD